MRIECSVTDDSSLTEESWLAAAPRPPARGWVASLVTVPWAAACDESPASTLAVNAEIQRHLFISVLPLFRERIPNNAVPPGDSQYQ
jgi:hypothetical protein